MATTKPNYSDLNARLTLEQLVERDTKAGTLEIYVRPPYYDGDRHGLTTFLAGKWLTGGGVQPLAKPQGQYTHLIGRETKTPCGLTADEAARIDARLAELSVVADAAEARYQAEREARRVAEAPMLALREERRALVGEHNGLVEDQRDAFDRRWDREDEGGAFAAQGSYDARIAAAFAAIAAFDAAHPEVRAAIDAEREAKTARALAID